MGQEELQNKRIRYSQFIPWAIAVLFISVLSACFIASCSVTHYSFLHCKRPMPMGVFKLSEYHAKLTCIREKSGLKVNTWGCCPAGWRTFQSNCYFPFNDNKTWADSERNCVEMGAHLATINSAAEQNFITQFLDRRFSYFLGLRYVNHKGRWHLVDRMPFNPDMVFWHEDESIKSQREDCMVLVNDQNKWARKNFSCNSKTSSICTIPATALK